MIFAHQLSEANLFVSAINPKLIKDFDNDSLRKVKSDKADAVKIARYALDKWQNLKQYSVMDELRNQLKTTNRQFNFYMKHKMAMKNNLIGILDQTYPGVNTYFDSPARNDGSQKWVENVGIWRYISDISYSIGKRFTCYSMGFPFVACYDTDVLFFYAD